MNLSTGESVDEVRHLMECMEVNCRHFHDMFTDLYKGEKINKDKLVTLVGLSKRAADCMKDLQSLLNEYVNCVTDGKA